MIPALAGAEKNIKNAAEDKVRVFLCLLSAILLILSFPNFNIEFFAWFGFVPLFLL